MREHRRRLLFSGLIAAVVANLFVVTWRTPVAASGGATFGTLAEFSMSCCLSSLPFMPHQTVLADVNRDGVPDYLVANSYTGNVDVRLGHGDGTFGTAASYAASGQPMGLAVGDLNGDGISDLVVADGGVNGYANYTVLLGNGDGTFRLGGTYSINADVNDVALGDLNGDTKLDVVITSTSGEIAVLFGNGDGTFGSPTYYSVHGSAQSATVADLNGDGRPDVVVAEGGAPGADAATIGVFLNTGNGTLGPRTGYNIGNTYATSVNIAVGASTETASLTSPSRTATADSIPARCTSSSATAAEASATAEA